MTERRNQKVARARAEAAWVFRQKGFTYTEIGTAFGVGAQRGRQLSMRGERLIETWKNGKNPLSFSGRT